MDKSAWMFWLRRAAGCAVLTCGACADLTGDDVQPLAPALSQDEQSDGGSNSVQRARARLQDVAGETVGRAWFVFSRESTFVTVSARLPPERAGIHGLHVHANDVADNGEGCIADPDAEPSTHFASVDGHFNPSGETHGHHKGDLPALVVTGAGEAFLQFRTDQFKPSELQGRALIIHASSDNYGNVPVGEAEDQYTANSEAATELTGKTGNAGVRIACGVIE